MAGVTSRRFGFGGGSARTRSMIHLPSRQIMVASLEVKVVVTLRSNRSLLLSFEGGVDGPDFLAK
jgi:hypothetical protein